MKDCSGRYVLRCGVWCVLYMCVCVVSCCEDCFFFSFLSFYGDDGWELCWGPMILFWNTLPPYIPSLGNMYFIGLITLLVYDQSINSTGEVTLELRDKKK